jgi:hypothetical protein
MGKAPQFKQNKTTGIAARRKLATMSDYDRSDKCLYDSQEIFLFFAIIL